MGSKPLYNCDLIEGALFGYYTHKICLVSTFTYVPLFLFLLFQLFEKVGGTAPEGIKFFSQGMPRYISTSETVVT